MPDPKLQTYLARHYLSGRKADVVLARAGLEADVSKKKKRKREQVGKDISSNSSLQVRDEEDSWKRELEDDDDESEALNGEVTTVAHPTVTRFSRGGWKDLAAKGAVTSSQQVTAASEDPEEAPQVVDVDGRLVSGEEFQKTRAVEEAAEQASELSPAVASPFKPRAGLRTKEEVRAERLEREEAERREQLQLLPTEAGERQEEESRDARLARTTVYRDETGRRINVVADDAVICADEDRRRRREIEKRDWSRGQKQQDDERRLRQELSQVESEGVARYATDERMNQTLREIQRADDPALAFFTKKRTTGPQLPEYRGPQPPPNRFGIGPGYRWDGVDRGNGFERKYFEAQGTGQRNKQGF